MVKGSSTYCSVDGIQVVDASRHQVVEAAGRPAHARARLVFALHVGGLLHRGDEEFRVALAAADLVYADGAAIVLLAKLAGARRIERAATTDIGLGVISTLSVELGRPVRLALIGGEPGLADAAAHSLRASSPVTIVMTSHGYFEDDHAIFSSLRDARPDMIIVGLGMPREAKWSYLSQAELPSAVVMTCGGWFGFLAGRERRAPLLLQRTGLEWSYRLLQDFPRLFSRYALGSVAVARLIPGQLKQRRATR